MIGAIAAAALSLADIAGGIALVFHIRAFAFAIGTVILLKGLLGYASAISSGFWMDIFSLLDIVSGFLLLTSFSLPLPYSAVGIVHTIKGITMLLLSIPYGRL